MGYPLVTLSVAALVVLVTFGSFGQLAKVEAKAVWLLLAGLVVQFGVVFAGIPRHLYDSLGFGLIMFSYVLILAFCFVNIGIRGIGVITVGVALNALVIGLNQGMPTKDDAIRTASGRVIHKPIEPDVKHRPERSSDLLPFLTDRIRLPDPFHDETVSFGDLIIAVGISEFAYYASRRRYTRGAPAPETGDAGTEVQVPAPVESAVVETGETGETGETEAVVVETGETGETEAVVDGGEEDGLAEAGADPPTRSGKVALTPTLDQRMGMSAPRRSRTRSRDPSTRPS